MLVQLLCATFLESRQQALRAAPAQTRCGSACVGCTCGGAGGGLRAVVAAEAALAADAS